MTITITAIILVPTMDAVIATIRAGTSNTNFSDVETVLQNAADRVNRAPKSCDYTQYAQAAAQTNGWSASTTNVLQQHYVPGSSSTVLGSWAASACDAAVTTPPDLAVQLVTITVTSPDGKFQKTLQVVKSALEMLSLQYPQAKQTDATLIVEPSIMKKIDDSGFVRTLYKK